MQPATRITYTGTLETFSDRWLLLSVPASLIAEPGKIWLSGTLNGRPFQAVAEPHAGAHSVPVSVTAAKAMGAGPGDLATLDCTVSASPPALPPADPGPVPAEPATPSASPESLIAYAKLLDDKKSSLPEELKGWNWGAFLLGPVWGSFYGVWSGWLMFIPYVGVLASIPISAAHGRKGNEWAWKAKPWASPAEFRRVQRNWAILGIFGSVLLVAVVFGIAAKFYGNLYSGNLDAVDSQLNGAGGLQGLDLGGL